MDDTEEIDAATLTLEQLKALFPSNCTTIEKPTRRHSAILAALDDAREEVAAIH